MSKWMTGSWEVRSWATGGGAGPAAEEGEGRTLCLMGMPSPDLRSAGCGALHAALILAPERATALEAEFVKRLGACKCRDLKGGETRVSCQDCVRTAAQLVEEG